MFSVFDNIFYVARKDIPTFIFLTRDIKASCPKIEDRFLWELLKTTLKNAPVWRT